MSVFKKIHNRNLANAIFLLSILLILLFLPNCSRSPTEQNGPYSLREDKGRNPLKQAHKANAAPVYLLSQARAALNSNEADIFQQGDTLIIRLKGLHFLSSVSRIEQTDHVLLSKVEKVISEMGKSDILIEGHTDSLGGKSVNKSLSMNRALSVKDYLVKHDKNRYLDVKANGLDYQRPLATNATPGGRALNRRVEIRVLPVSSDYYRQDKSTVREAWPLL